MTTSFVQNLIEGEKGDISKFWGETSGAFIYYKIAYILLIYDIRIIYLTHSRILLETY